jgi:hypothetical protein
VDVSPDMSGRQHLGVSRGKPVGNRRFDPKETWETLGKRRFYEKPRKMVENRRKIVIDLPPV